jgi:hypothetical protein
MNKLQVFKIHSLVVLGCWESTLSLESHSMPFASVIFQIEPHTFAQSHGPSYLLTSMPPHCGMCHNMSLLFEIGSRELFLPGLALNCDLPILDIFLRSVF